jgi:hypothetical protein
MMKKYGLRMVLATFVIVILGLGVNAYADSGMGYGRHGWGHHVPGWHHGGYGFSGSGYMGNLTEEDIRKLQEERTAFFAATRDLRMAIFQKRLELGSEIAKKEPDTQKAANLQKELSDLKAQMEQKRLDHILKIKKISPEIVMRFMNPNRMGFGKTDFGMMGPGGYGGNCPNYPYGGSGGDADTAPGMMGSGDDS